MGQPGGSVAKNLPASAADMGSSPESGRSLEKEMATYSKIVAWKIPWIEEPGGLQSMGSQRIGHDWATNTFTSLSWGWLLLISKSLWSLPSLGPETHEFRWGLKTIWGHGDVLIKLCQPAIEGLEREGAAVFSERDFKSRGPQPLGWGPVPPVRPVAALD